MSMAMLMRRLGAGDFTVHGMRSAARSWMADQGVAFELAEAALGASGRQRGGAGLPAVEHAGAPPAGLAAWATFVTGPTPTTWSSFARPGRDPGE